MFIFFCRAPVKYKEYAIEYESLGPRLKRALQSSLLNHNGFFGMVIKTLGWEINFPVMPNVHTKKRCARNSSIRALWYLYSAY